MLNAVEVIGITVATVIATSVFVSVITWLIEAWARIRQRVRR